MTGETDAKKSIFTRYADLIWVVVVLIGVGIALYNIDAVQLEFKADADFIAIVTSLFVVAIFMERSIEALVIPARIPDRKEIEQEIDRLKKDKNSTAEELLKQKAKLENYKLKTAKIAIWFSLIFGLIISIIGVRTLAGLVNLQALAEGPQLRLFDFADVVLTGGVISGGSAAIDKIGRSMSDFLKRQKESTKN